MISYLDKNKPYTFHMKEGDTFTGVYVSSDETWVKIYVINQNGIALVRYFRVDDIRYIVEMEK